MNKTCTQWSREVDVLKSNNDFLERVLIEKDKTIQSLQDQKEAIAQSKKDIIGEKRKMQESLDKIQEIKDLKRQIKELKLKVKAVEIELEIDGEE